MPEPEAKPEREPRALSTEYHKARKQLMLWAGILFIWELVGIDLEKAKEAGGNAGALITAIKSPQAVPWVLLVLVGYFLFKLWVEWSQCELARRKVFAARIDFMSAWIVTGLACGLYIYQAISRTQFADVLQKSNRIQSVTFALPAGMILMLVALRLANRPRPVLAVFQIVVGLLAIAIVVIPLAAGRLNWKFALLGIGTGGAVLLLSNWWSERPVALRKKQSRLLFNKN